MMSSMYTAVRKFPIKDAVSLQRGEFLRMKKYMISRKCSRMMKEKFAENKVKYTVILILSNETNTIKLEEILVENKPDFFLLNYRIYLNTVRMVNLNILHVI